MKARHLWRAPFWLLALATGAKSFADNPLIGSRRLNRLGLHVARLRLAHRLAWSRRRRLARSVPSDWKRQFDRDGYVEVPNFLAPDAFERLRHGLLNSPFDTRQQQQGDTLTRRVVIGPKLLAQVPELRDMLGSKRWRSVLAYVAATRSKPIYYIQTIAVGASEGPPDPQIMLHSDTFHPSMKAWLFLTDVEPNKAPLTYCAGSHLLTPQRIAWEQARSEAIEDADRLSQRGSFRVAPEELGGLDLPQPTAFAVRANTLVAIDTSGFHARGVSDAPTVRVEIWAYSRRNPFLPWTGLDPFSVAPLAPRRADWLMNIADLLDRCGMRKQHWLKVGSRRPTDV